jgi:hypothetical protein
MFKGFSFAQAHNKRGELPDGYFHLERQLLLACLIKYAGLFCKFEFYPGTYAINLA